MPSRSILSRAALFALFAASGHAMANTCSKEDIQFYLQSGFSHEQVVRLCTNAPPVMQQAPAPAAPSSVAPVPATPAAVTAVPQTATDRVSRDDLVYFKTAIESDQVDLTRDTLSYKLGGCIKYGEVDDFGFKEKACVDTLTTIQLKGLQVLSAKKGIWLVQEQELIVAGDIRREVLNIDRLTPRKRKELMAHYSLQPAQLDIPVRSGIDPRDVAARLRLLTQ